MLLAFLEPQFGHANGCSYCEKYLSPQESTDSDVVAGNAVGAADIDEWSKNCLRSPFGRVVHAHNGPGAS